MVLAKLVKCSEGSVEGDVCKDWKPNGSAYPLCKGNGSTECNECNLYEEMDERFIPY